MSDKSDLINHKDNGCATFETFFPLKFAFHDNV